MSDEKVDGNTYQGWIKAFQIFAKYTPDEISPLEPTDDMVYCGSKPELVSEEDTAMLEHLGWFVSEDYDCWCKFT